MSVTHTTGEVGRPRPEDVPSLVELLERGFGSGEDPDAALRNQHLLDALDLGEYERFLIWPGGTPAAVLYLAPNASAIPAGDPAAARALSGPLERSGWRVLIGESPLAAALVQASPSPLLRRGPRVREQRFMILRRPRRRVVAGLRPAELRDLEAVTDFACRLHEEDLMGPPISRSGRASVRVRMMEAISRSVVWVVEREGKPIGKLDLSLCSKLRGAQIAGVYIDPRWRNFGIATGAVGEIAAELADRGLPGVTLHVRSGNAAAVSAYEAAGFEDAGALVLALR